MRHLLVTMGRGALRALALRWFLRGFAHSGRGFHGESMDISKHPAVEAILIAEFDRVWNEK